jgi:hypothetical protein
MNTSTSKSPQAAAGAGVAPARLARAAKTVGGILSFSSLALGSAQFYKVSSARLGPGAFMLSIPKVLGGSLAPFLAVAGAVGAAFGLSALWLERGKVPRTAKRSRLGGHASTWRRRSPRRTGRPDGRHPECRSHATRRSLARQLRRGVRRRLAGADSPPTEGRDAGAALDLEPLGRAGGARRAGRRIRQHTGDQSETAGRRLAPSRGRCALWVGLHLGEATELLRQHAAALARRPV